MLRQKLQNQKDVNKRLKEKIHESNHKIVKRKQ